HSTSRADIVRRYASQVTPQKICPQIGFWALIPIFKPQAPEVIKIGLGFTLYDQSEINCPIGELTVYPDLSYIEQGPESLPSSTNDNDLIAICLASYAPPLKLFRQQIESIRNQTYRNWICVISDDGSPPETLAEMRKIIGQDDRFRLYTSTIRLGFYHNFERS